MVILAKSDLEDLRAVTSAEGEELAKNHGGELYETSSKTGQNIDDVFHIITNKVLDMKKHLLD